MITGTYNLDIYKGEPFSIDFVITDDLGVPINLTDYSGSAPIKNSYSAQTPIAYFNLSITNPTSGMVTLSMTDTGSAALPVTQAIYGVEFARSGVSIGRYLRGYVNIYQDYGLNFP